MGRVFHRQHLHTHSEGNWKGCLAVKPWWETRTPPDTFLSFGYLPTPPPQHLKTAENLCGISIRPHSFLRCFGVMFWGLCLFFLYTWEIVTGQHFYFLGDCLISLMWR